MTRRRIAAAFISVAALLFAGRWVAGLVTQRLWASAFSDAAVRWVTELALLRLLLDAAGAVLATVWFTGNLTTVMRGIERVQLSRAVPDGQVREAVPPSTLLGIAVLVGAILGLLAGGDLSSHWMTISLAWQGVRFGIREPLLEQDLGVYVAQFPFWTLLQDLAFVLVAGAGLLVLLLYIAIGALRWMDGRPAITDHARRHLGVLAALLAIVIAGGQLLAPLTWIADGPEAATRVSFTLVELGAPVITGFALATSLLSLLWAFRGRHAVFAAGWFLLLLASVTLEYVLPSMRRGRADEPRDPVRARMIAALPAGLDRLQDTASAGAAEDAPIKPSLWSRRSSVAAVAADSTLRVLSVDPAPIESDNGAPGWLVLRDAREVAPELSVLRDDRTSVEGQPAPLPSSAAPRRWADDAVRPAAPGIVVRPDAHGPLVGGPLQRLLLAWSLQSPALLNASDDDARAAWLLDPRQRLAALLPMADWGTAELRIIGDRPLWLVPGYLLAAHFPLAPDVPWRESRVAYVRPALLAVIDAETGEPRIALRDDAGPLGDAWAAIVGPLIQSWTSLPSGIRRAVPYPAAYLAAQARVLERDRAALGRLTVAGQDGQLLDHAWRVELEAPARFAVFESPDGRELSAVVEGQNVGGRFRLVLRTFSPEALRAPSLLPTYWSRFPTFAQLRDSVRAARGEFDEGPVRLSLDDGRPVALQSWYARADERSPARLAWVSVAAGERLGAGRSFAEAWENLRGGTVPAPAGGGGAQLDTARRWLQTADEALRRGDLQGFARAFDALKAVLETTGAPARQ